MRNQEWNASLAQLDTLDLAQLVLCLLFRDTVDGEAALGVVDKTEVLASLFNGDHIHEAGWVGDICADLAVDLDKALHEDALDFASVERILQSTRCVSRGRLRASRNPHCAYRFRMKMMSGRQSRSLWGPADGRGAYFPESLSRSQCDGALRRFWCFFGPM